MHSDGVAGANRRALSPRASMMTSPPGSTSRVNVGPVMSSRPVPEADPGPGLVHALAEELGVWSGEVDELEDAQRRGGRSEPAGPEPARVDDDQLAGLDLPDERRSDDVERTGLGGERVALLQAPEHE